MLAIATVALFGLILPASGTTATFTGVARSIDGDSLYVGDREVRLFGIDAPEYHQTCTRDGRAWACGADAAKQLSSLVTGRPVRCEQVDTDEYGRIVARCAVGGVELNRIMVLTGYAIAYRHYSNDYVSAEQTARTYRRGIWASTFEMASMYRHEGELIRQVPQTPVRRVEPQHSRSAVTSTGSCKIKGNRGAHGWIYHLPGMPYYDQTHAEQWFCSEADAQAAGYRRAKAR